ncbi:hypothetical protein [Amycolatopsis sp. NPDC021455]|uniref:hypothetical protein n=1 Tax=Amycolatopsis sp. NPDC021455 TaxID=3154901 RepID=UPI0033C726DA
MCDQVRAYLELRRKHGAAEAEELSLAGLPERQRGRIGPLIEHGRLADGLAKAVPGLDAIGISTEFVDVSTEDEDAALEVMLTCSCLAAAERLGLEPAEPVVCGLDLTATERAFPDLTVRTLSRQTEGRKLCVFRFSRPARDDGTAVADTKEMK